MEKEKMLESIKAAFMGELKTLRGFGWDDGRVGEILIYTARILTATCGIESTDALMEVAGWAEEERKGGRKND